MYTYVVRKGDTLYRLARRFGIHVNSIVNANPQLENPNVLVPGQVINIPERGSNLYVVQPGDTLYDISIRFQVPMEQLAAANPDVDPAMLIPGQSLIIPPGAELQIVDTMTDYGYMEMTEDLEQLSRKYPFLELTDIGSSVMGKRIPLVKIGQGRKKVHFNGSFHANEWITTVLLMRFLEDYAEAVMHDGVLRGERARYLYNNASLWIVPMVNPDGVELVQEGVTSDHPYYRSLLEWNEGSFDFSSWKANIRGVDLNDQYPAHWEVERGRRVVLGPGPRDYVGTAPLTEPEALAIAQLSQNTQFDEVYAFHTQGEEIYWNYRDLEPPESEQIALRLAEASGYRAVKLTGSDAGYKDWFIQEFRRTGFTIEAGIGRNPLPITDFPSIYQRVLGIMVEGLKA
ncbi:M14 family zinc carboxypeptidase [Marinicrinis lubricantis]|uniref:M14 family zinc carboxypeptidase n=1 Tax=Marinicrinis lubricantis TaxID=2086470 RepID=A0ABW1IT27_9BACL